MDTLSHTWKTRRGEIEDGHVHKREVKYIDFIISNQSLSEIIDPETFDRVTMLGWSLYVANDELRIEEFLTNSLPELKTGRIVIYGCPECGDIDCGAITAEIISSDNKIIWRNFGLEDGDEDIDFDDYKHVGPFEFDKQEYTLEFAKIKKEISKFGIFHVLKNINKHITNFTKFALSFITHNL